MKKRGWLFLVLVILLVSSVNAFQITYKYPNENNIDLLIVKCADSSCNSLDESNKEIYSSGSNNKITIEWPSYCNENGCAAYHQKECKKIQEFHNKFTSTGTYSIYFSLEPNCQSSINSINPDENKTETNIQSAFTTSLVNPPTFPIPNEVVDWVSANFKIKLEVYDGTELIYEDEKDDTIYMSEEKDFTFNYDLSPGSYTAKIITQTTDCICSSNNDQTMSTDFTVSLIESPSQPETQTNETVKEECEETWECTEWTKCASNMQFRDCIDEEECNTIKNKPVEQRSCGVAGAKITQPELCGNKVIDSGENCRNCKDATCLFDEKCSAEGECVVKVKFPYSFIIIPILIVGSIIGLGYLINKHKKSTDKKPKDIITALFIGVFIIMSVVVVYSVFTILPQTIFKSLNSNAEVIIDEVVIDKLNDYYGKGEFTVCMEGKFRKDKVQIHSIKKISNSLFSNECSGLNKIGVVNYASKCNTGSGEIYETNQYPLVGLMCGNNKFNFYTASSDNQLFYLIRDTEQISNAELTQQESKNMFVTLLVITAAGILAILISLFYLKRMITE